MPRRLVPVLDCRRAALTRASPTEATLIRHSDVMSAPLGNKPSYFWRSWTWSRGIISKGSSWRIGDGQDIDIFQDTWLPSRLKCFSSVQHNFPSICKVRDLINEGAWNKNLIANIFPPVIAEEIIQISLPSLPTKDDRFWCSDGKGNYSVKEGYKIEMGFYDSSTSQSTITIRKWWKFLWALNIPLKVRTFLWRLANDFIPTGINLAKHHVPYSSGCRLCNNYADTSLHSIFFCPRVVPLWKHTIFMPLVKKAKLVPTLDFCIWMQQSLTTHEFEIFALSAWLIWKERQRVVHGPYLYDDLKLVAGAESIIQNFQISSGSFRHSRCSEDSQRNLKWSPPPKNSVRLDVGASVNTTVGKFGIGGITRDDQGRLFLLLEC